MFLLNVLRVVCYAAVQVLLFIWNILNDNTVLYETYHDISSGCFIDFSPHFSLKLTSTKLKKFLCTTPYGFLLGEMVWVMASGCYLYVSTRCSFLAGITVKKGQRTFNSFMSVLFLALSRVFIALLMEGCVRAWCLWVRKKQNLSCILFEIGFLFYMCVHFDE